MAIMNIKNFTFTYPGVEEPSLRNINLPIEQNKITALIGPSGCGKSTLLRSMNRIGELRGLSRQRRDILGLRARMTL